MKCNTYKSLVPKYHNVCENLSSFSKVKDRYEYLKEELNKLSNNYTNNSVCNKYYASLLGGMEGLSHIKSTYFNCEVSLVNYCFNLKNYF